MERLWSYLRRFAKSTKEMRPSHRIDVLTSALLHYASRVRINLGLFFVRATLILALSTSWYAPMYALHKGKKVLTLVYVGASLVKRLKNAQNTQHSATEDLSKLINESNG